MKSYTVIQPFNIFEYNPKRQSHKLKRFDTGDRVSQTMYRRLHNPEYYLK